MNQQETQINLLVGLPCYGNKLHVDTLNSILSYYNIRGLNVTVLTLGNNSLVPKARNKIFSIFVDNPMFDYLLFLDADMFFPATELLKLINANKHLIGAPVRLKDLTRPVYNIGDIKEEDLKDETKWPIFETTLVGTAIMLISKELAQKVSKHLEEKGEYIIEDNFYSRTDSNYQNNHLKVYNAFPIGIDPETKQYLSEDYYFCKLCRDIGYKVYVNLDCKNKHNGDLPLITAIRKEDVYSSYTEKRE